MREFCRFGTLLSLLLLMVNYCFPVVFCHEFYMLSKIESSVGVSAGFAVANESDCQSRCFDNVSAVSYSKVYKQCLVSYCAIFKISSNVVWNTLVCSKQHIH